MPRNTDRRSANYADAVGALSAITSGVYGPGRGPLGMGITGGGRGFWERSPELWGQYTKGPMPGMAEWTDVRRNPVPRMPMGARGGAMVGSMGDGSHSQWAGKEVPRYDRAGRPIKGRKAIGRGQRQLPSGPEPVGLPPGRPSPVLVGGEAREPVPVIRQPPTLGVPRRGDVRGGLILNDKRGSGLYTELTQADELRGDHADRKHSRRTGQTAHRARASAVPCSPLPG